MPHQCLGCGFTFAEGSSELLSGCPRCKGTRFFYTAEAVDAGERQRIQEKASKDIRQVVTELLHDAAPETAQELMDKADGDGWAKIRPRDIRRLVKKVQAEQIPDAKPAVRKDLREEPVDSPKRLKAAAAARAQIIAEMDEEESSPDTVNIRDAGEYEIDVRALLENDPIVVHKDGAYLIHLPSLFPKRG